MNKTAVILILFMVAIFAAGIFFFSSKEKGLSVFPEGHEYFWSSTCSHCKKVEDFLSSWEGKDQITIEKFQVDDGSANVTRLVQRGKDCKLPQSQIGSVPLLVAPNGKCFIGDTPIINYFKSL